MPIQTFHRLKNHAGFMKYFKNTSWMMGEQILRMISGLFVGVWIARYLGPEQFGTFSYALAFTAIFGGIAKLGLDGIVVRELVNHPEQRDEILGTAFWLKMGGAVLAIILTAFATLFTNNDSTTNLYIFIITVGFIFQSFEVIDFYFQSQVLAKFVSICKLSQLVISSIIKIFLVLNEADLVWFVVAILIDQALLSLGLLFYSKNINLNISKYSKPLVFIFLKESWFLILAFTISILYMRIDQIMIKYFLGDYQLGLYSAAIRLSEATSFISAFVAISIFPKIIESKKLGDIYYKIQLKKIFSITIWMSIIIASVSIFFIKDIIKYSFGISYIDICDFLGINFLVFIFTSIGSIYCKYLINEGFSHVLLQITFLGLLLNILMNVFLIPKFGLKGAAFSSLITQFSINLIFDLFRNDTRKMFFLKIEAIFYPIVFLTNFRFTNK